ncbi:MAG: tetratricopeptide repeat protein [Geobacteraceae bacterium]|nr:tetratricopeptide repeat protein [Geobacteraceae bacterium]
MKKLQLFMAALALIGLSGCAMPQRIPGGGGVITQVNQFCSGNWCSNMPDSIDAYAKGDYTKAISGLERARRQYPNEATAFISSLLLCQAYYDQRQYDKSVELCNVAILYGEHWGRLKVTPASAWDYRIKLDNPYTAPGELIPAVVECKNILKEAQKRSGGR